MSSPHRMTLGKITVFFILAVLAAYLPETAQQPSVIEHSPGPSRILHSPSTINSLAGVVGTNVPIVGEAAPDRQQVETTIAADPRNPSILVAGAQDYRLKSSGEHRWHGYYRSTDGGVTWSSSLLPGFPGDNSPQGFASPLHNFNATSDPVLAFDRMGNLYYAGIAFNITSSQPGSGTTANFSAFVAKYINDGATYSAVAMIAGADAADKPWIAVDTTGGPSDGNVYLAFDGFLSNVPNSFFATLFTSSSNGGKTFSLPFYAPPNGIGQLPGVTVDTAGNVYVSTEAFDPTFGTALNYTQVTKIANGGTTVVQNVKAINPAHMIPSPLAGGSFRALTIPQIAADSQGVYLVFDDVRLGNSNVYLTRSTDGGLTWTSPLRVNDVLSGQHFFPTIALSSGVISLAWYDSRVSAPGTMTALDVFYANSLDNGSTFSPSDRVTNVSFNPNIVKRTDLPSDLQPFMGDYIGIAATPLNAYPLWADNRFSCDTFDALYNSCVDQDAFTAAIGLHDFAISANPTSQTILQGASGAANITLTSLPGFQGNVTVSSSSMPAGLPINPESKNVTLPLGGARSFNLTFATTTSTLTTSFTVNVAATSGPTSHSTQISVTVNPSQRVGGSIVPVDKLGLLIQFLPAAISISVALTTGIVALKFWSRSKGRRQTRASSK